MEHENKVLTQKLDIRWEPEKIFPFFLEGEYPFFLDSGFFHPEIGRYSFMGKDPYMTFKSRKDKITIIKKDNVFQKQGNPIDILDCILNEYKCSPVDASYPPFQSGAVGYLAYDLGWHMEVLPNKAENDIDLPESYFSFYDCVLAYDHLEEKCYLFSTGLPIKGRVAEKRAKDKLKEISAQLYAFIKNPKEIIKVRSTHEIQIPEPKSHFTKEEYCKAVQKAKDYISAGDIYQVNMTQRFETKSLVPSWELYCKLRKINPAPFAAYLDLGEGVIVSASPERFIKIDGNFIETRPIKGTRPRKENKEFNEKMKNELLNSEKDRAELVMIVDLERNDLGRVCEFGTVKVEELFRLETYATVFHLVSTIIGKLKPNYGFKEVIKATFPGGSITGAPKIRAMEIIEELEPVKRGIYTGSIGYLNLSGNLDLNIVIRTFIIKDDKTYFQVGGGIVADSEPEKEYQETLDKAKALIMALQTR
jgi:para-aminobenzoate synthetase component 1